MPLIKAMPDNGEDVKRVRVRKKKRKDPLSKKFNIAFDDLYHNLHGRSVFCNGKHAEKCERNNVLYYVFPVDGFKYLYNPEVDFHGDYLEMYQTLDGILDTEHKNKIFVDVIRYSYLKDNPSTLSEALLDKKEIIIYNIPCYYSIKVETVESYIKLLEDIKSPNR